MPSPSAHTNHTDQHVGALLTELRSLAEHSPAVARKETWELLERLAREDRRPEIATLWAQGRPPEVMDGALEGLIMGSMWGTPETKLGSLLIKIHPTWLGKTFDMSSGTGFNRLVRFSQPIFLVIAAGYRSFRSDRRVIEGFHFRHSLQTAAIAPHIRVRALDYGVPEFGNPSVRTFPIARTRDEVVELVPGVYLGRALLTHSNGTIAPIAHFALRDRLGTDLA
ncbi:hypothetical protein [Rhodococcus sp. B50]|uniref:hypothetical protein n=1 Tax=Rhodococcus sp. B50 TaxID=2682847 RepID=UPI0019DABF79|nr:hypothetical protein [Rhodococcus sp. B50]MBS9375164.1 hypothetical protein [Rhodococcus sp. B50]